MAGQEKVRVLIVDDIAETRDNIRRMLQFDNQIEVIGTAQSGREAISLTGQTKPDVVLMDINMPDMDGITATETIRRTQPATQVVILSVQSDPSYMRRAMLAGARDFLTKPPMIDELISAIRQAGKMAQDERAKAAMTFSPTAAPGSPAAIAYKNSLGKIIVLYSPKGGTGCTTLATNLAVALKADEPKVLLVDAGMQFGDVPVFLNEQVKNTVLDLAPRVDEMEPEIVELSLIHI
jgi:pilus assembly protein CpaE